MYEIAKNVIMSQRFELGDMLSKLDALWLQGDLTDAQRTELVALAREKADPTLSIDLLAQIDALDKRVTALENGTAKPTPQPDPAEPNATEEYPAFDKDKLYRTGDKCTQGGKHYICQLPEYTEYTTFGPLDYPSYWQEQK